MGFKVIKLFGKEWIINEQKNLDILTFLASQKISIKQSFSEIRISKNYLLKVINAQKRVDFLRKFYNSQARREFFSSLKMNEMGILTPKVFLYGFRLSLFDHYDSFILMEFLPFLSLEEFFSKEKDYIKRKEALEILSFNLLKFLSNNIIHKDSNLNNILYDQNHKKLFWIDNDLKKITSKNDIDIFIRRIIKSPYLNKIEKDFILDIKKSVNEKR